ncbi:hypothetical protein [Nonomuraea sp. NPDC049504]|uniref:hypothetical protein n=1 Tax=Nonomuraea sp. NPDC049504 TaxID=3154729 RepID=UPI003416E049
MGDTSLLFSILARSNLAQTLRGDAQATRELQSTIMAGAGRAASGVGVLSAALGVLSVVGVASFAGLAVAVAGLGLGILGLGVAAVAANEHVKAAFGGLVADTKAVVQSAAAPLIPYLLAIASEARTLLLPLGESLSRAFTALGPAVLSMASSVIAGLRPLVDAIGPITEATTPLLVALGAGLRPVLAALASTMLMVAETAGRFAPQLELLFVNVGMLVSALGPLLSGLIDLGAPIIGPLLGLVSSLVLQLSTGLRPVFAQLGPILGDTVSALSPLLGVLGELVVSVLPLLPPLIRIAAEQIQLWVPILTGVVQAATWLVRLLVDNLVPVLDLVARASQTAGDWMTRVWSEVERQTGIVVGGIRGWWNGLVNDVTSLPGRITAGARGMWDGIVNGFKAAVNWIISGWNRLSFTLPRVDIPYVGSFGGFTVGVPQIPYLAKGGNIVGAGLAVVGEAGPELVSLPRGAQVTPLGRGGGDTYVFQITGALDPLAVAREVEKVLKKYARDTGRVSLGF